MKAATELRPASTKRLKTLDKGKEKMELEPVASREGSPESMEGQDEEDRETCGICLSDSGRSIRGRIDSCDHYFCFVCIMEWAKIESRCPLCKRRFQSIRRPPVRGFFPAERVVDIPVRDQVYHPLGNESTLLSDPYADVNCSICHGSQNEELLLLCDLCDSAAHTYCVGMGATVPDGDWYCPDCTITRDTHSKSHFDDDSYPQDSGNNVVAFQLPEEHVSVSDIVADEILPNTSRRFATINLVESQRTHQRSVYASHGRTQNSVTRSEQCSAVATVGEPSEIEAGARTLRNCRNLHDRIQSLRVNWNSLRAGSLRFSSNLSAVSNDQKRLSASTGTSSNAAIHNSSISQVNQEDTTLSSICSVTNKISDPEDISKAWKMLEIAKAAQKTQKDHKSDDADPLRKKNVANHRSMTNHRKADTTFKEAEKLQSVSSTFSDIITLGNKACSSGQQDKCSMFKINQKRKSPNDLNQTPNLNNMTGSCGTHLKSKPSPQVVICHTKTMPDSRESVANPGSAACSHYNVSTLSNVSNSPVIANSQVVGNKINGSLSLNNDTVQRNSTNNFEVSEKVKLSLPDAHASEHMMKTNDASDNTPKSEIQSLVKLNLRLLNKDQRLGAARFKEVARIATHTILAACGLEHSTSSARSFPSSVCKHSEQVTQLHKSKLMSNSCRKCFYAFIQNVVNSVVSEKNQINEGAGSLGSSVSGATYILLRD